MFLSSSATFLSPSTFSALSTKQKPYISSLRKESACGVVCLKIGVEELSGLIHNKALVAAAVSSAIGQFSKPFTSAIDSGSVDFKAAFRSGGMPSTHSAGVVAAATSLGLQRGFADSIFGMSVVFAAIVMYDAQGVRREVGYQAKILNVIISRTNEGLPACKEDNKLIECKQETSIESPKRLATLISLSEKETFSKPTLTSSSPLVSEFSEKKASRTSGSKVDGEDAFSKSASILAVEGEKMLRRNFGNYIPLNESVGHTEIQVLVGALLGFIVSLSIDTIL